VESNKVLSIDNKVWGTAFTAGLANQLEHAKWEGYTFYDLK